MSEEICPFCRKARKWHSTWCPMLDFKFTVDPPQDPNVVVIAKLPEVE